MRNTTRALALLMIIAVLASCGAQQEEAEPHLAANGMVMAPYLTDFDQAKEEAAASGKNILIDYYTDW